MPANNSNGIPRPKINPRSLNQLLAIDFVAVLDMINISDVVAVLVVVLVGTTIQSGQY
jgi:hypothetical protein